MQRWATALLVPAILAVFGFSGCWGGFGEDADKPWEDMSTDEVRTDGLPVAGMIFFHPDYTGNVSFTTDNDGDVVSRLHYTPMGEVFERTGNDCFRYGYNRKELDRSIDLLYYGARYYDPSLGRFITPDTEIPNPAMSQSLNRYMYVIGSPVQFNDPDGHKWGSGFFSTAASMVSGSDCAGAVGLSNAFKKAGNAIKDYSKKAAAWASEKYDDAREWWKNQDSGEN